MMWLAFVLIVIEAINIYAGVEGCRDRLPAPFPIFSFAVAALLISFSSIVLDKA